MGRTERNRRADELLAEVGLQEQVNRRPGALSGGQQQRVAIARALINESRCHSRRRTTGALDSKTSQQVMEILRTLHARGKTIVMVTHSTEAAKYADRIVLFIGPRRLSADYARDDERSPCQSFGRPKGVRNALADCSAIMRVS